LNCPTTAAWLPCTAFGSEKKGYVVTCVIADPREEDCADLLEQDVGQVPQVDVQDDRLVFLGTVGTNRNGVWRWTFDDGTPPDSNDPCSGPRLVSLTLDPDGTAQESVNGGCPSMESTTWESTACGFQVTESPNPPIEYFRASASVAASGFVRQR
jgi:hypothetical protein